MGPQSESRPAGHQGGSQTESERIKVYTEPMTPSERIALRRVMTILGATIDGPEVVRCSRGSRITAQGKVQHARMQLPPDRRDWQECLELSLISERRRYSGRDRRGLA